MSELSKLEKIAETIKTEVIEKLAAKLKGEFGADQTRIIDEMSYEICEAFSGINKTIKSYENDLLLKELYDNLDPALGATCDCMPNQPCSEHK